MDRSSLPKLVPVTQKEALLRLTKLKYQHTDRGIQYDEVRATGLCNQPKDQSDKDLSKGEAFHYSPQAVSPAEVDCKKWRNDSLNPDDWLVFRT